MNYNKGDYFIVPNRKKLAGLDAQTQTLFMWICARADVDGRCFPSISNLEKTCNLSRATIVDRLKKLDQLGLIDKTPGNFTTSNTYQIKLVGSSGDELGSLTDELGVVQEMNSNNNQLTIKETSLKFLDKLPKEVVEELTKQFKAEPAEINKKARDLADYCRSKGKKYKDYKSFLRNALRKDFGERPVVKKRQVEIVEVNGQRVARFI